MLNSDCPRDKACIRSKCVDPCPGTCASNAICTVLNHVPMCSCPSGMEGNAFVQCRPVQYAPEEYNGCRPSPCGPLSQCREINNQAVCSCLPGYYGSPPTCHPECVVDSDCARDKACSNQKCVDPCDCGINAECRVSNHRAVCNCRPRYTGNALVQCHPIGKTSPSSQIIQSIVYIRSLFTIMPHTINKLTTKAHSHSYFIRPHARFILIIPFCIYHRNKVEPPPQIEQDHVNPCFSSPCGANAECRPNGDSYTCNCLPDFIGTAPNCRPECVSNSECANHLACINRHCRDPCPGVCGQNAECHVVSHTPNCECIRGYVGDPFTVCSPKQEDIPQEQYNPCIPSPCASNAICREQNGVGACQCLPEYFGNPYENCRPECTVNSDCPSNRACIRNKCQDPCPGACGQNAECHVVNHLPSCVCRVGFTGDSYRYCSPIQYERKFQMKR